MFSLSKTPGCLTVFQTDLSSPVSDRVQWVHQLSGHQRVSTEQRTRTLPGLLLQHSRGIPVLLSEPGRHRPGGGQSHLSGQERNIKTQNTTNTSTSYTGGRGMQHKQRRLLAPVHRQLQPGQTIMCYTLVFLSLLWI